MITARHILLTSLTGLFLIARADDAFTFRRIFVVGETDTYDLANSSDMTIDLSAMGAGSQSFKTEMGGKLTYKTLKVNSEKGEATVEAKFHDLDMKMDMPGMQDMPKEFTMTGTMDARNRYKDVKLEGMPDMMRLTSESSMKQLASAFQFPEGPVKVGESWDFVIPKDGKVFTKDQTMKVKFLSTKVVDGKTLADLDVSGDIELDIDSSKLGGDGGGSPMGDMTIKGKVHNKSLVRIDVASGKLVYLETDSNSDMNIEMAQGKLPMSGTTKSVMKKAKS